MEFKNNQKFKALPFWTIYLMMSFVLMMNKNYRNQYLIGQKWVKTP